MFPLRVAAVQERSESGIYQRPNKRLVKASVAVSAGAIGEFTIQLFKYWDYGDQLTACKANGTVVECKDISSPCNTKANAILNTSMMSERVTYTRNLSASNTRRVALLVLPL